MQKAQDILFNTSQVDIVDWVTTAALALGIFRLKYFDDKDYHIHIPTMKTPSFEGGTTVGMLTLIYLKDKTYTTMM